MDALKRVREVCMSLPEVTERLSHGAPTWFVRDKKSMVMFHDDWDEIAAIVTDAYRAEGARGGTRPPVSRLTGHRVSRWRCRAGNRSDG